MKVAVLMSTYNGEKYIKQQLDSILNQTCKNIDIIIRDDGSKDSTISIIKDYMLRYSNIKLEIGQNIGFLKSFYSLLESANEYDYYCYADQDDYWESNKIKKILDKLEQQNNDEPNMGFSDSDYYDENLNFVKKGDTNRTFSFENSLVECVSQGMTMMINKKARDIIIEKKSEDSFFHDQWTYMICTALGNIIYVNEPLVRYRRISESVTAEGRGFVYLLKWRIKKLVFGNGFKKLKNQILDFKKLFYNDVSKDKQKLLNLFTEKYNLKNAIKKFIYPKRFRRRLLDEIMVRILFLFGVL